MKIEGNYFSGKSSVSTKCTLLVDEAFKVYFEETEGVPIEFSCLEISPRVGNSVRYITFPDGSSFETNDNSSIDQLVFQASKDKVWFSPYQWERSLKFTLLSIVIIAGMTYALIDFGIPSMSRQIAHALPDKVSVALGSGVLDSLDENYFKPSVLSHERQEELQNVFNSLLKEQGEINYRLHFRGGGAIGANAFALPDGGVVMTDELIALAEDDHELAAVMLHEIGHVVHRHSLRKLIESGSLTALILWITGDVSAASSWIIYLPVVLVQSGYSRDAEWEADTYALERSIELNISLQHFANIMTKLSKQRKSLFSKSSETNGKEHQDKKDDKNILDYFSSHPASHKRIDRFEDASKEQVLPLTP